MAWQGRALGSWVLREVRVDFRQKMGERRSGQELRSSDFTTQSSPEVFCFLDPSVCSHKSRLTGNTPI